jgi:shikimate dehydrogenase
MWPQTDACPWPEIMPFPGHWTVYDLVYNPLETRLLRLARESGARPIGGLEMLIHQGALAFELWTGHQPPVDVMRAAARRALGVAADPESLNSEPESRPANPEGETCCVS